MRSPRHPSAPAVRQRETRKPDWHASQRERPGDRRPRRRHRDDQRQGGRLRRRRPRAGPRRDRLSAARARARPGRAGSRRRGRRHARGDPRRRGRRARPGRADRGAVVQRRDALARRPRRAAARRSRRWSRGPTCGRPSRPSACAPSTPSCTTARARRCIRCRRCPSSCGSPSTSPRPSPPSRRWAGIKELVVARLTGAWAVDHSIASGTGLLNLQRARLGPRGARHRGHRRRRRCRRSCPTTERLALGAAAAAELGLEAGLRAHRRRRPTGRWPTSASARCAPAWPPARSAPAARCG